MPGFRYAQILLLYTGITLILARGYFWPGTGISPGGMGWDERGTHLVRGCSDLRVVPMHWGRNRGCVKAGTVSICGVFITYCTGFCSGAVLHDQSFLANLTGAIQSYQTAWAEEPNSGPTVAPSTFTAYPPSGAVLYPRPPTPPYGYCTQSRLIGVEST